MDFNHFIEMLRTLRQVISNIRFKEEIKPIGRWDTRCDISADIKSALANLDCCGDRLCGDPLRAKDAISYERNKKRK
jgi:hypothetical protein